MATDTMPAAAKPTVTAVPQTVELVLTEAFRARGGELEPNKAVATVRLLGKCDARALDKAIQVGIVRARVVG